MGDVPFRGGRDAPVELERRRHGRTLRRLLGALTLGALACAVPGCAGDFDTARATPPRGSLGREMFSLVCDRVGAQALREDVTGISYRAVCHPNASGEFTSDTVDAARLPPLDPNALDSTGHQVPLETQEEHRAHRIARIEALARRRNDLVLAFDDAFTNEALSTKRLGSDPATACQDVAEADIRTEMGNLLGRFAPLYDDDTIAHVTRGLSRVLDDVEKTDEAKQALARFDARQGYRPREIAVGVARPLLSYPRIAELASGVLPLLSADAGALADPPKAGIEGKAHAPFDALLGALEQELRTAQTIPPSPPLKATPDDVDPTLLRIDRPRGNLEFARTILLAEDGAYSSGGPARWLVKRDARGFASVALASGRVPAPFVDVTGNDGKPDGLPDIDADGRFVTKGNAALSPFLLGGAKTTSAREVDGRAPAYEYVDVSKTYLSALARDLVPLLDPDPDHHHETVMNAIAGLAAISGAREVEPTSTRTYSAPGGTDSKTIRYRGFRSDASPLLDLVHAASQVLASDEADDLLALLSRLASDKPNTLARVVGIALELKKIADDHPEAHIPENSTFWDEMLDVVAKMADKPVLIEDVLRSFEADATLDLRRAARAYLLNHDELTYDRSNLNGPTFNLTTNSNDTLMTPVDRSKPDTGENRSAFQRFLQVLHDANGLSICTKPGAVAHLRWKGVPIDFPSVPAQAACVTVGSPLPPNPAPRCGLFRIKNIAEEIINAVVGTMQLDIRNDCMREVIESPLTGIVGGSDALLEAVSGIQGFKTHPTIPGLARIMYFELPSPTSPGDTKNKLTLDFLRDLFDDLPTIVCPPIPFTDTDGAVLNLRQCADRQDTLNVRDRNALFALEQLGFLDALKPIAMAFRTSDANLSFVDIFDTLHRHWGSSAQTKVECDPNAPKTDARWCSQDGGVTYEPLLADVLATDLFPTLQATVKDLHAITVEHCTKRDGSGVCTQSEPWDGVKTLAETVKALVLPSRNAGTKHRDGTITVTRNDGTKNAQVTPIYLLIDALKGFDQRLKDFALEGAGDRTPMWRSARSQIVDQFLGVEGAGKDARFANRAFATALPTIISAVRSQLAAHCADPNKGCAWARTELTDKATEIVTGPTFAALLDVLDALRADDKARPELERLLVFLLVSDNADASWATLTALADLLQVFEDDAAMTAMLHALASSAAPDARDDQGRLVSRGFVAAAVEAVHRVVGEVRDDHGDRQCSKEMDPNRALPVALRRLIAPRADGQASPIEVLIDVIADVNRVRPEETTKLEAADYGSIAHEISDFCMDPSRGLEQVYAVLKQATSGSR